MASEAIKKNELPCTRLTQLRPSWLCGAGKFTKISHSKPTFTARTERELVYLLAEAVAMSAYCCEHGHLLNPRVGN